MEELLLSALAPGELRVFYAQSASVTSSEASAHCKAMLSDEERERHRRFRFEEDQHSYLAAHALTRGVLGRLLSVPAAELRFQEGERGRPELSWPEREPRLRFNLSHTRGLSACAVCLDADVGVDVEHVDRRVEIDRLAESVFSKSERAALARLDGEQQRRRFFELWTLKESYIKAVGKGLALPLAEISLELDRGEAPSIAFGPCIADDPARWFFKVEALAGGHMLASAMAEPGPWRVLQKEFNPHDL